MIKANELRIGNWVNCYNVPHQVAGIDSLKRMVLCKNGEYIPFEHVERIPMSEDFLVGFEKEAIITDDGIRYEYTYADLKVLKIGCCSFDRFAFFLGKVDVSGERWLHTFQNTFYLLTTDELDIAL